MKNRGYFLAGLGTLSILAGSLAIAGQKSGGGAVSIYGSGSRASGSVGYVRNSQNAVEYIGCKVVSYSASSSSVICSAQDAAGTQFSCSSTVPSLVGAAAGISGDSYISLTKNSSDNCTYLAVDNSSTFVPKAP